MRVWTVRLNLLFLFFLCIGRHPAFGQPNKLMPESTIEKRISKSDVHRYVISLQAGQYVRLVVEQKGIDLGISVDDPDGIWIADFDSTNGSVGPEYVTFVAESDGDYEVELHPMDAFRNPPPGNYSIQIVQLRQASESENKSMRRLENLRQKGMSLVNEVISDLTLIRSPESRASFEVRIAGLMWDRDSRKAAQLLHHAAEFLQDKVNRARDSNDDISVIAALRTNILHQLENHEPDLAIPFVRATRKPHLSPAEEDRERELELSVARAIAADRPKIAFEIAESFLKVDVSSSLVSVVRELQTANPALASELAHDIFARLKDQSLLESPDNALTASGLVMLTVTGRKLVPEFELRDVLQKMAAEVLAFSPKQTNEDYLQKMAVQQMTSALRQFRGDSQSARPDQLAVIDVKTTTNTVAIGKFDDALHELANTDEDYKSILIDRLVNRIGPGIKRATALSYLEEIRHMLPPSNRAVDYEELQSLLKIAGALARYDSNRAFDIVEPLVDQLNELLAAARILNGFSEVYFKDGEFILDNDNGLSETAEALADSLGELAMVNFQRARSAADHVNLPNLRLDMYLSIAKQALMADDD